MRITLNLDDDLITEASHLAVRRGTTLSVLFNEAIHGLLARETRTGEPFDLPVFDGGGFPEGFPFHGSTRTMVEFLEGPDAPN